MRILVMFDLPVGTESERKNYRLFRKHLIKSGFLMLQESVYCKIAQNTTVADAIIANVRKNRPDDGLVQVLKITKSAFVSSASSTYIVGESKSDVLDSDERLVVL